MKILRKIDNALGRLEDSICCILLCVMSCTIFLQIVCRMLKVPLVWSEELGRFMFIWLIYISVCCATRRRKHLCVDILPIILPEKGKKVLNILANVLSMLFFVFVAYYGMGVINKLTIRPQYSAAMHLNMIIAYAGPYFSAALAVYHYIVLIIEDILVLSGRSGLEEVEGA